MMTIDIRRSWRVRRWAAVGAVLGSGMFGYAIHVALASGIPSTQALTYAGVLEDGAGAVLTGNHNVQVAVWDAATAGNKLCEMATAQAVALASGRFVVTLPDACAAAFGSAPNTWVDVAVDGASTGRSKVGVVPYAIEANHAVAATSATSATTATVSNSVNSSGAGTPLTFKQATFTVDNASTAHSSAAPGVLPWGYGLMPAGATVIGVKYESGLHDGCQVTPSVDYVDTRGFQRILVEIVGISGPSCADVGQLSFSYIYVTP